MHKLTGGIAGIYMILWFYSVSVTGEPVSGLEFKRLVELIIEAKP